MRDRAWMPGFTVIELLVVVTMLGLLLSLALPSFGRLVASIRIRTEAQKLFSAVHLTRSEAIKRNLPVSLCPRSVGVSPNDCSHDYSQGWMMFVNPDRDRRRDLDEVGVAEGAGLVAGFTVTNRKGNRRADELITYFGDGSSRRNLTLLVCSASYPDADSWSVVLNRIGRPRMARNWGDCPIEALP